MAERTAGEKKQAVMTKEAKSVKQALDSQRKIKIMIPSGKGEEESNDVFVGINGYSYLIPRDKEVEVPEAVVRALQNAVTGTVRTSKGPDGETVVESVKAPRFPMQVWE